jgi:hypothetical protein
LTDQKNKRLAFDENDGIGNAYDYEFVFKKPVTGVRSIRFAGLGDQGKENPYDDIAIGEVQVE